MEQVTEVAESTPAVVEAPILGMEMERGPLVNLTPEQRTEFRKTGNLPESPKKQEASATSSDKAGESETPKSQEKPKQEHRKSQTAAERIAELRATIAKIEKGAGLESKEAESQPAKPEPKAAPKPQQQADKEPTTEDVNEDGTPKFKTYEDFSKALARWEVRQELREQQQKQWEQDQAKQFQSKMEEARGRRENFDEAIGSFREAVGSVKLNPVVQDMLNDSDVFPDLVAVIGGTKESAASFAKMAQDSPGKAIRYLALTETLIAEELEGKQSNQIEEVPVKPKTQAPRPPSEAGGRAATPADSEAEAVKTGDFRTAKAEFTRKALAKLKG